MHKQRKRRNPYAAALRRLGQKVIPNKKVYSRKGRSKDRPFLLVCFLFEPPIGALQ